MAQRSNLSRAEAERLLANISRGGRGGEITDAEFAPGVRWKTNITRGLALRNVEWAGATVSGRLLGRGRVESCHFERVNFDSLRCHKVDFVECQFESVTFGEHYFSTFKDCSFLQCSFTRCRFDAIGFAGSTLCSCRFDGLKGERTRWTECVLEDVVMLGQLVKASFIDTTLQRVDLSGVALSDCAILGGKHEDLQLPDEPDNFAVDPKVMIAADERLRSRLNSEALAAYRHFADVASQLGPPLLVNGGILTQLSSQDRDLVMATLYELRRSAES